VRLSIPAGGSVVATIRAIEAEKLPLIVTPNYLFVLAEDANAPVPTTSSTTEANEPAAANAGPAAANPGQYTVDKLRLAAAHRLAKGDNVLIAVIDSGVDAEHPDIAGAVADRYDTVAANKNPDAHGTGMAGAIASHLRLLGVAPGAKLLTVRAFAPGSTDEILKGLDWAVGKGARIINMSFAGPRDPMLQETLKRARQRGALLIAAAGNAGPTSPPLFPGADANVIAVTATDIDDNLFTQANRGRHIAIAAPGVDILVPAPSSGYQLTTGTSVATAHVSGVAALLMSRNPKLDADAVRAILLSTAKDLGPKGRDDQFGWGLIDPVKALHAADQQGAKVH
jgi:subtilisin family serine protease